MIQNVLCYKIVYLPKILIERVDSVNIFNKNCDNENWKSKGSKPYL